MSMPHKHTAKAVDAILQWKKSKSESEKPQLLPQDDFVYLVLTLKKIPHKSTGDGGARLNPYKIHLPHSLLTQDSLPEICLIIDDRPKSNLTSDLAKKKIKAEEVPVTKVIKLSKLKTDYKAFEAKRKLCDSYDMFFADARIIPLLPKLLGKQFFRKKKQPLPLNLTHKNWKAQMERVFSSALLYFRTGTCSVVKVAKVSMERDEIIENVNAAIDGIVDVVPKKRQGVRSLFLKFSDSVSLPLFQAVPDVKLKIQGVKENADGEKGEGGDREVVVREKSKKSESSGKKKSSKKKGRIHEVQYMDAIDFGEDELGSDIDEGANEGVIDEAQLESGNDIVTNEEGLVSENDDKSVGKKRKKGSSKKGKEITGEKPAKKKNKVKKGNEDGDDNKPIENEEDDSKPNEDHSSAGKKKRKGELKKVDIGVKKASGDDDDSKLRENKDISSAGKKKRKGELAKADVVQEKSSDRRAKKTSKKGDSKVKGK